jgi:hypothetical protein
MPEKRLVFLQMNVPEKKLLLTEQYFFNTTLLFHLLDLREVSFF